MLYMVVLIKCDSAQINYNNICFSAVLAPVFNNIVYHSVAFIENLIVQKIVNVNSGE